LRGDRLEGRKARGEKHWRGERLEGRRA